MKTNCNEQLVKIEKHAKLAELVVLFISCVILGILAKKYAPALELLPALYFAHQLSKRFFDKEYVVKSVDKTMTRLFKRLPARFKKQNSDTTNK